jgi:hypothetical protein
VELANSPEEESGRCIEESAFQPEASGCCSQRCPGSCIEVGGPGQPEASGVLWRSAGLTLLLLTR